jgi:cytochrome c5
MVTLQKDYLSLGGRSYVLLKTTLLCVALCLPFSSKGQEVPIYSSLGKSIYEQYCIVCHRDGVAGAPKWRDPKDWNARLSGRGLSDLLASSLKGLNAMPARGTCMDCNEKDLEAAIQYMLPERSREVPKS